MVISGCAGGGYVRPIMPAPGIPGVYHSVERGQTLWRIAKTYNVELGKIARINRLPDATRISAGQRLFIPGATKVLRVDMDRVPAPKEMGGFIWPLRGEIISFYGAIKGDVRNKGIDIMAKEGTEVVASRTGVVSFCDEKVKGLGKTVIIDHGDGYSTVYAHNSQIMVKAGEAVGQNTVIAKVGSSGRASRPYLHFEIRKGHNPQNPFYFLP